MTTGLRPLLATIALAVLIVACAAEAGDALPTAEPDGEPGFEHVHGLGVNPGDDRLYAATHFGLWRVDDGVMERVGDAYHDLMGFTVVDEDRFLASGHPLGGHTELPPHLGLIASDDAGETWREVSLMGEADFHALRPVDDGFYGFDASNERLMVTDDGTDWEVRHEDLSLLDVVVAPGDAEHLVAVRAHDLMGDDVDLVASRDGGRSWETLDGPAAQRLSWAEPDRLIAVDDDGAVHLSDDGGASWQQQGELGHVPGALLDHDGRLHADAPVGLVASDDDGASWQVLATAEP